MLITACTSYTSQAKLNVGEWQSCTQGAWSKSDDDFPYNKGLA